MFGRPAYRMRPLPCACTAAKGDALSGLSSFQARPPVHPAQHPPALSAQLGFWGPEVVYCADELCNLLLGLASQEYAPGRMTSCQAAKHWARAAVEAAPAAAALAVAAAAAPRRHPTLMVLSFALTPQPRPTVPSPGFSGQGGGFLVDGTPLFHGLNNLWYHRLWPVHFQGQN